MYIFGILAAVLSTPVGVLSAKKKQPLKGLAHVLATPKVILKKG